MEADTCDDQDDWLKMVFFGTHSWPVKFPLEGLSAKTCSAPFPQKTPTKNDLNLKRAPRCSKRRPLARVVRCQHHHHSCNLVASICGFQNLEHLVNICATVAYKCCCGSCFVESNQRLLNAPPKKNSCQLNEFFMNFRWEMNGTFFPEKFPKHLNPKNKTPNSPTTTGVVKGISPHLNPPKKKTPNSPTTTGVVKGISPHLNPKKQNTKFTDDHGGCKRHFTTSKPPPKKNNKFTDDHGGCKRHFTTSKPKKKNTKFTDDHGGCKRHFTTSKPKKTKHQIHRRPRGL